jgi:hypothetical protein
VKTFNKYLVRTIFIGCKQRRWNRNPKRFEHKRNQTESNRIGGKWSWNSRN